MDNHASAVADLKALMERRFDAIDSRFDAVDRRFDAIDRRFEAVDRRFEAVDRRFEAFDRRFEAIDRRFLWVIGMQFATLLALAAGLGGIIASLL